MLKSCAEAEARKVRNAVAIHKRAACFGQSFKINFDDLDVDGLDFVNLDLDSDLNMSRFK